MSEQQQSGLHGVKTVQSKANGKEALVDEQQLVESLRDRYPTLAQRVEAGELALDAALAEADKRDGKPRSGYARLRTRHHNLILEHRNLQEEYHTTRKELVEWRAMYLQLKDDLAPLIEASEK